MRKAIVLAISLVAMLTLAGCTTIRFTPMANAPNQRIIYVDGNEVVVSEGESTAIAVGAIRTEEYEMVLHVAYINNSYSNIDALPDTITVQSLNDAGAATDLKVYSADEYLAKLRTAQAWEAFGQALSAASSSYNAGYSTTYTSGSAYAYGSGGYASAYGSSVSTTYDPATAAAVNAMNQQNMANLANQQRNVYQMVQQALLKRTTLFPGQNVEGKVVAKWVKGSRYVVTIPFGDDVHVAEFTLPTQ